MRVLGSRHSGGTFSNSSSAGFALTHCKTESCGGNGRLRNTVDDDADAGSRSPVKVEAPQPTDKEIEEHELTHLPFRNWCKECVQGRGMQAPHFRAKKDDHQIKEFHMDFGPTEVAGQTLACLVVREVETRLTMAAAVFYKTTGTCISERIVAFLHETGCLHGDIIVRSDQEPAVMRSQSGNDPGPERWREIRCRKQSLPLARVSRTMWRRKPFSLYKARYEC